MVKNTNNNLQNIIDNKKSKIVGLINNKSPVYNNLMSLLYLAQDYLDEGDETGCQEILAKLEHLINELKTSQTSQHDDNEETALIEHIKNKVSSLLIKYKRKSNSR